MANLFFEEVIVLWYRNRKILGRTPVPLYVNYFVDYMLTYQKFKIQKWRILSGITIGLLNVF